MLPCGMMPYPVTHPLETGFDSAWQTLRQETKKITAPAQCGSCAKKDVCGVCAAVRVTETGRFDQVPGYMCQWTDAMIEKTWEAYLERDKENGH
jgi:radical SAM protein with 4Fe4S-binding SPASM domain